MRRTHYQNLKVAENAPPEVIKAAWRVLSQQFHPDLNPGDADAVRKMQIINEAYEVLSDPERRARHDEAIRKARAQSEPRVQQSDEQQSAVTMWQVFEDGVSCGPYSLAELATLQKAGKITLKTFVAGWGMDDWMPLSEHLKRLNKVPVSSKTHLPRAMPSKEAGAPVKDRLWEEMRQHPVVTAFVLLYGGFVVVTFFGEWLGVKRSKDATVLSYPITSPHSVREWSADELKRANVARERREIQETLQRIAPPVYVRPVTTPLGYAWPLQSSYMPGCPILADDGYCQVTIDNMRNSADVHVKLFHVGLARTVRECFIPKGSVMQMDNLIAGQYQVRYMALDSGAAAKAEPFWLTVEQTTQGVSYSIMTLTLYTVQNGNTRMTPIRREEF